MIHEGIRDLLASERGMFCLTCVVACTVFLCLGMVSSAQWIDFVKWAAVTMVASKTVEIATRKTTKEGSRGQSVP